MLRIATRDSPLALWQANHVAELLARHGYESELVPLVSRGDVDQRPIDSTRQVGLFTKRIQQALLDDEADVAVHSLKDLPTEPNDVFWLAATPQRETVHDVLVSPEQFTIDTLPAEARVGTGSRRRAAQLRFVRPDLNVLPIRGNVQTRLAKLDGGDYEAIVLAEAGLNRLQMQDVPRVRLSLDQMLPAPGQGSLGVEVRINDDRARDALQSIDHQETRCCVTAERHVLAKLHGGCLAPIAVHASVIDGQLSLVAVVLSADGQQRIDRRRTGPAGDVTAAVAMADELAVEMINAGAMELIQSERTA